MISTIKNTCEIIECIKQKTVQKLFSINEHHAACWTTIAWEKILCFHSAAVFLKIEPGPLSKYDATKLTRYQLE